MISAKGTRRFALLSVVHQFLERRLLHFALFVFSLKVLAALIFFRVDALQSTYVEGTTQRKARRPVGGR